MARGQVSQNEFIVQAITEATGQQFKPQPHMAWQRQEHPGAKMIGPILKQPMFNWKAEDKYKEL